MSRILLTLCVSLSPFVGIMLGETAARIEGVVKVEGVAASGVTVTYNRVPELSVGALGKVTIVGRYANGTVVSDATGHYAVDGLLPGRYYVCAMPRVLGELGSCEWGTSPLLVEAMAGANLKLKDIVLRRGKNVAIQLLDVEGRLKSERSVGVGVISDAGYYAPAKTVRRQGNSYTYEIAVPEDLNLRLLIDSGFTVSDERERVVPLRVPFLAFRVPKSEAGKLYRFILR